MGEYFIWNASPEIFNLCSIKILDFSFCFIKVRWYSLMFIIGFIAGYHIVQKIFRAEGRDPELVSSLLTYTIFGVIIGARLGHVLFYDPNYYFANPIEIFKVWKGGLASHGGGAGAIISVLLFCRRKKLQFLWLLDRVAAPTALLCGLVRIGNFFNSAIYGIPTQVPWAVVFKRTDPSMLPRHPTQLYESFSYLLIFVLLCFLYWGTDLKKAQGRLWGLLMVLLTSARFTIEFWKENQASFEQGLLLNMGQMLSVPFFCVGLLLVFRGNKRVKT